MDYKHTDQDGDTLRAFQVTGDGVPLLHVISAQHGAFVSREGVVELVEELQKWLLANPKVPVEVTVKLSEVATNEEFCMHGVKWTRSHLKEGYAVCQCPEGLYHLLWPSVSVQVMR